MLDGSGRCAVDSRHTRANASQRPFGDTAPPASQAVCGIGRPGRWGQRARARCPERSGGGHDAEARRWKWQSDEPPHGLWQRPTRISRSARRQPPVPGMEVSESTDRRLGMRSSWPSLSPSTSWCSIDVARCRPTVDSARR